MISVLLLPTVWGGGQVLNPMGPYEFVWKTGRRQMYWRKDDQVSKNATLLRLEKSGRASPGS